MHREAFSYIAQQVKELPPRRNVVEFGGLDINGSVRSLFADASYVSVDPQAGRGVDVVMDALDYIPETSIDTVVCCEVLEHAEQAAELVAHAADILAPGGVLLITAACDPRTPHSAVDGGHMREGEFYQNIDPNSLSMWLGYHFGRVDVVVNERRGDVYAIAVMGAADVPSRPARKGGKA